MRKAPPKKPTRPKPPPRKRPERSRVDPMAQMFARDVQRGHGVDQAVTFDQSEDLGSPRGWIGTRNIALDRGIGSRGLPLGRIVEVFGLNGCGKSTAADQVGAQCQAEGGLYVLGDTERNRDRPYMATMGVVNESTVLIGGKTIEIMFEEIETVLRRAASVNLAAWKQALDLAGYKTPALPQYKYNTYDPNIKDKQTRRKKPTASFQFFDWSMDHAAALLKFQKDHGLDESSVRDAATRAILKPVVVYTETGEPFSANDLRNKLYRETIEAHRAGEVGPLYSHDADRALVICWDSVGGTPTKVELQEAAADLHVGMAARAIKQNLRRLVQLIDDAQASLICVNQVYHKIDSRSPGGAKMETYGGEGIKYHSCIRISLKRIGTIKMPGNADRQIGQIVEATFVKNKVGVPFRKEIYGLIYGRGADNGWTIYNDLKNRGIIKLNGTWSSFPDPTLPQSSWQGWHGLSNMLAKDPALYARLAAIYMEG